MARGVETKGIGNEIVNKILMVLIFGSMPFSVEIDVRIDSGLPAFISGAAERIGFCGMCFNLDIRR